MDREQASINEALLRTDTEIAEPLSDKQPEKGHENDKPKIHVAITKIQDILGTMAKLFERFIEDKADKPLQGVDGNVCQLNLMTAPTRSLTQKQLLLD